MSASDIISRNIAKKKKKQETENSVSASNNSSISNGADSIIRRHFVNNARSIIQKELRDISTVQLNTQNNVSKRFKYDKDGKRTVNYLSDSADYYKQISDEKNNFKEKSDYINLILEKYGDSISDDEKKSVNEYLTSGNSFYENLYEIAKGDDEYFSQWENEHAYNYQKQQAQKIESYSKMADEELDAEIEKLSKGNKWYDKALNKVAKIGSYLQPDEARGLTQQAVAESEKEFLAKDSDIALINREKQNRLMKSFDALPDNQKKLIEEYVESDRKKDETHIEGIAKTLASGFAQTDNPTAYINSATASDDAAEIAKRLDEEGPKDWNKYVEVLRTVRDEDYYAEDRKQFKDMATEHPVLASGLSVLAAPTKILGAVEMLDSIGNGSDTLNYNSPYFIGNHFSNDIRETVMANHDWKENEGSRDWFDTIYGTAMSTGDTFINIGVGGGGVSSGLMLGIEAATDTAIDVAQNGGDKTNALLTGLVAGVNESIFESISIGKFKSLMGKPISDFLSKEGIKTLAGNVLKSVGVNASEEMNTEAANLIVDYLVNGGTSQFVANYNQYRAQGLTDAEAKKAANKDLIKQVGDAGLGGALQGIFMGGIGTVGGIMNQRASDKEAGSLYTNAAYSELRKKAETLGIDVSKYSFVDDESVGRLERKVFIEQTKKDLANKAAEYGVDASEYNLSKSKDFNTLAAVVKEAESKFGKELNETSGLVYKRGITNRLVELGVSEAEAPQLTEAIVRYTDNDLSVFDDDVGIITSNESAQQVLDELNSIERDENYAPWVKQLDDDMKQATEEIKGRYLVNKSTETVENTPVIENESLQTEQKTVESGVSAPVRETPSSTKSRIAKETYSPTVEKLAGSEYQNIFNDYYTAGAKGTNNFEEIDQHYSYSHDITTEEWRRSVYDAAKNTRFFEPGVHKMYRQTNLPKTTQTQFDILDALGKKYGVSFIVCDTLDGVGGNVQGVHLSGTNRVAISLDDVDGNLYLKTAGHECFHVIESWNAKGAEQLTKYVINYLKSLDNFNYEAEVQRYAKLYNLNPQTQLDAIHSEMAADCMFDVFSNEKFVKKLVNENKTLAEKIKAFLTDFINELKSLIKHYHNSPEIEALKDLRVLLEDINTNFLYHFEEASKNMNQARESSAKNGASIEADIVENVAQKNTTDKGSVKYSLKITHSNGTIEEIDNARQLTNEQAVEYLEIAKSGELYRDSYIPIRKDTPQVIIDTLEKINEVIENNSLIIQVKKARQAMNTKTSNKKAKKGGSGVRGHSLTPTQIVEIMNNLDNPNAIIYQTNRVGKNGDSLPNNVAVFVEYDDNGKESVAIIEFDSSINPEYIGKDVGDENYHTVVSVFEPDTERDGIPYDYMDELLSNPNNYELEIVRRQPKGSATGEKHPNTSNELPSTETILSENPKKSSGNNRYSLSDSENKYNEAVKNNDTETAQKMVDEAAKKNGYTIKAYHGTPSNDFTIFDAKKIGSNTDAGIFGSGFYFTTHKDTAGVYATESGHTMPVYLRVNNPWWAVSHRNIQDVAEELGMNEAALTLRGYGGKGKIVTPIMSQTGQFSAHLQEHGYDAVVVQHGSNNYEVVVFDSNAIKSADPVTYDNNGKVIPLSERFNENNNDIRFSRRSAPSAKTYLYKNPVEQTIIKNFRKAMTEMEGYVPDVKALTDLAKQLKKETESSLDIYEIRSDIKEIFDLHQSMSDSNAYEYMTNLILRLSKKLVDSSKILDAYNLERKQLRDELKQALKGRKFRMTDTLKTEIVGQFGSVKAFRDMYGLGFHFTNDANTTLDQQWSELCAEVPGLLDADIDELNQPTALVEAFNATHYETGLFDEYEYDSQVEYISNIVLEQLNNIPFSTNKQNKTYEKVRTLLEENDRLLSQRKKEYLELLEGRDQYYKKIIKQGVDSRKATELKQSINRTLNRLVSMAANPGKNRHIPLHLIEEVKILCETVTVSGTENQEKFAKNLSKLEKDYEALSTGADEVHRLAYDDYVKSLINQLSKQLKNKNVASMSLEDLILTHEVIKSLTQRITRANKLFADDKSADVDTTANAISQELTGEKDKPDYRFDVLNEASDRTEEKFWMLLKPIYAFRMIGSETLTGLEQNLRKGEDTWANDIWEAKAKRVEIANKYNWNKWRNDTVELDVSSGRYTFTVEQLMMLYVAQQRDQYIPHLKQGGFVFEDAYAKVKSKNDEGKKVVKYRRRRDGGTHILSDLDFEKINNSLTAEQKSYATEMRDYLTIDLAEKGNSVTRKLYDINKFTETKYFPIKVAREFLNSKVEESDVRSVLSTSIMKDLQEQAKNPILLRDFDTMWSEHVQEMAKFHAFALPVDDFNRVLNFRVAKDYNYSSIKTLIETAKGKGAVNYIETFLKSVNGGVRSDSGSTLIQQGLTLFKKSAVLASASVAIQQPSAVARALAEVDAKYFAKTTITKRDYDELMQYAPVARIKSMGFFDTGIGKSTTDWLLEVDYNKGEKINAFFHDGEYTKKKLNDILLKAPEFMDELTWCHIWNAVKEETKAKTNLTGEKLLKKAGERFTEVIELTQVYDSVFAKSEYMRSKDTGAKMATAFMAEPTVSLNMLIDAGSKAKQGDYKTAGRFVFSFVAATALNAALKSIVVAARDDDEEKTYLESYLSALVSNFANDVFILNMVPIVRDAMSIFSGYSVERSDMAVVANVSDSLQNLFSDNSTGVDKAVEFAGALAGVFGIPLKNILRDMKATGNVLNRIFNSSEFDNQTTAAGVKHSLQDEYKKNFFFKLVFGNKSKSDLLYEAIINHNTDDYEELIKNYSDTNAVNAAIRKGLLENDERILQAAQYRIDKNVYGYSETVKDIVSDNFSENNVVKAVNNAYDDLLSAKENEKEDSSSDSSTEKAYSIYDTTDLNIAIETQTGYEMIIEDMISVAMKNGKTKKEAESSVRSKISNYWKTEYVNASSDMEREEICKMLDRTGLYSDIEHTASGWMLTNLKEQYKEAGTYSERKAIEQEIWALDYYSSRSSMKNALHKLISEDDED